MFDTDYRKNVYKCLYIIISSSIDSAFMGELIVYLSSNQRHGNIANYLIFGIVLCIGLWLVPFRAMHFNLSTIPGDLVDSRVNNYLLEHGYRWITGQVESFWNAPIFYPAKNTMAFSDNHLGTLLIYTCFRLMSFSRETSFQLWIIILFVLNYLSAAWVLRKFSINVVGAVCGAFIFSFSMPMVGFLNHPQLLPRFMMPLVFYYTVRYLENPDPKALLKIGLCLAVEFYCTIYMGYFTFFSILALVGAYIFVNRKDPKKIKHLIWNSWNDIALRAGVVLFSVALLLPLMIPYLRVALEYGGGSWLMTSSMLPRISSYFLPPHSSLLWHWLSPLGENLPVANEHQLFAGVLPLLGFFAFPVVVLYSSRHDDLIRKGILVFIALGLLFIATLSVNGYSLYRFISRAIPGLSAIRGVSRIILVYLFFLSFLMGVIITKLWKYAERMPRTLKILISAVLISTVVVDQLVIDIGSYSKREARNRIMRLERLIVGKESLGNVFVYMPIIKADSLYNKFIAQLDAMLATQDLNKATVNGYSGIYPKEWMNFGKTFGTSFDLMCPMLYRWMIISERQYHKKDWYRNLVIVDAGDRDPCNHFRGLEITSIKGPLDEGGYDAGIAFDKQVYNAKISEVFLIDVLLRNKSHVKWPADGEQNGKYGIFLSYRWLNAEKAPLTEFDARFSLPYDIKAGHSGQLPVEVLAPSKKGTYFLEFDLFQESVAWFRDKGSKTSLVKIIVK